MTVIENLDIVMGAQTRELDADIAKEINAIKRLKGAVNDSSAGMAAFAPITNQVSDALANFSSKVPGLSAATTVFKGASSGSAGMLSSAAGATALAVGFGAVVAGGAAAAHTIAMVRQELVAVDQLSDSAKKVGASFAELSTLRLSLGQTSGLDSGAVDASIQKMQIGLAEANATGAGDVFDSLKAIGLNAGELLKVGPLEAMKQISAATQDLKNPTDQLVVAYELFGKQGAALVNSLREGPQEIERMNQLATQLGVNLSDAQAEQVGAANDAWDEMTMVATGFYRQIAAEVAPVIEVIAASFRDSGVEISGWKDYIAPIVTSTAEFAGWIYDGYEAATVLQTTLRNIVTLNWGAVGTDIAKAVDFGTGAANVKAIELARENAEQKARENAQNKAVGDSAIAQIEREKEAKKALKEAEKEASQVRKKAEDEEQRAADAVVKKFDGIRNEIAALRQANELRAEGVKFNEQDLKLATELSEMTNGSSQQAVENLLAEKQALEQFGKDQEKAIELNKKANPMVSLVESMRELNRLRSNGLIDQKTFDKSAKDAAQSTADPNQKFGAASAQAGSVEAYKMLLERENGAKKDADALRRIQEAQLRVLENIERNGQSSPLKVKR